MDELIRKIIKLKKNSYTGTVTLAFYKGNLSKKIKLEVTEIIDKHQKASIKSSEIIIEN